MPKLLARKPLNLLIEETREAGEHSLSGDALEGALAQRSLGAEQARLSSFPELL